MLTTFSLFQLLRFRKGNVRKMTASLVVGLFVVKIGI
jgi:hypothetical protein